MRPVWVIAAALAVIAAMVMSLWSALNDDVTYALGGIETAARGGVSVWDVFVARPVAYRLLMVWLELPVPDGASLTVTELAVRLGADLLVAGSAVALFFGLRRYLSSGAAGLIAVATGLALIVAPPWHFLEPDWAAVLVAALAVGAACAPRRVWVGAVLGGFAAFLAIGLKLATFPLALLALLLIGLLDRRRAGWTGLATAVFTVAWWLATKQFLPWEGIWLNDQANLVANSPIHHGIRWEEIHGLLTGLGDTALISPIVAVAPAAAALLVRRLEPGRRRWAGGVIAVIATGFSLASAYGQGEFFMYHFAAVPVFAAGVWAAAFALCPAARTPLAVTTAAFAVASFFLLRRPAEWRLDNVTVITVTYLVVAVVAAVVACSYAGRAARRTPGNVPAPRTTTENVTLPAPRTPADDTAATATRRSRRPASVAVGVVALAAAIVLGNLPKAPFAFSGYNYRGDNDRPTATGYTALRERIGADTPVLYLTFGSANYKLGNPTHCRYPSPQWLQRGTYVRPVRSTESYADNLRCLTDDHDARYLVWQPFWFNRMKSGPQVSSLLQQQFDCSFEARIPAPKHVVVCPRR
ncbi:hypothetical protein [Actinoplanes sp. M2I2]|uniref:hypothetical protein n=1 Tax=Actinoplanes sp. M2I2 TaxID=1734444 RepID=UPI0020218AA8|nr:hypothetical protein [Actinoplanes sp. M2I2]